MPANTFNNVDLPVPLPPTRPTRSPSFTTQLRPSKSVLEPKCFPAEESWIMNMKMPRGSGNARTWRRLSSFTISALGSDPANRDFDCCPRSVWGIAAGEKKKRFQHGGHREHREDLGRVGRGLSLDFPRAGLAYFGQRCLHTFRCEWNLPD